MKYTDREFVRFVVAGALNTSLSYVVYYGLLSLFSFPLSYTLSYVFGIVSSYVFNCLFVFRTPPSISSAMRYPLIYVVQYAAGLTILAALIRIFHLNPKIAALVVVLCNVPLTFALNRLVLRRTSSESVRVET